MELLHLLLWKQRSVTLVVAVLVVVVVVVDGGGGGGGSSSLVSYLPNSFCSCLPLDKRTGEKQQQQ